MRTLTFTALEINLLEQALDVYKHHFEHLWGATLNRNINDMQDLLQKRTLIHNVHNKVLVAKKQHVIVLPKLTRYNNLKDLTNLKREENPCI
jgi:hypothetical protein